MRIVVTGGRGVIGQSLVPALIDDGHRVSVYDILDEPEQQHDVCNGPFLQRFIAARRPDVVIHMAAQVGRLTGESDPLTSFRSNCEGTYNVVNACHQAGCWLINFSTSEVYGHNSVFGKPDILEQNGIYGLTKLAAEGVVKHYVELGAIRAYSIRPFMVYGKHEVPNGEFRSAVSNFIDTAMKGDIINAHRGCVRSWCHVDDFIDGLRLVLATPPNWQDYKAFSIGTDEYRTMEDCAKIVIDTVGTGSYVVTNPPAFLVSEVKKADFSHIRSLGFEPKVTLEEGVRRTYEWMRER